MNGGNAVKHYHAAIVGAGPAGTGPLVYGAWSGRLQELTGRGLAIIESGARIGPGRLGRYGINSNSTGATFIECLEHEVGGGVLRHSVASPARDEIARHRDEVLPLSLAERLLQDLGRDLEEAARASERSEVYLNTRAEEVRILGPGRFEVALRSLDGAEPPQRITASRVLLATGGNPQVPRAIGAMVTTACAERCPGNQPLMLTADEFLQAQGRSAAEAWLENYEQPQVLVIGGAHSAFSSAWMLLERMQGEFEWRDGAVTLLHRSPIKVFYDSVEHARADGFAAFGDADIGGKGEVFPIGGLRGDAKALYRRVAGLGGAQPESRLRLRNLPASGPGFAALDIDWSQLALVVFATGYIQPEVPVRNARGAPIALQGQYTDRYVDQRCRVLDVLGNPLPGLYAAGFTSGFSPVEMLSGEASYDGKENSVWLCQHMLGEALFDALVKV